MKTLKSKSTTVQEAQSKIDLINTRSGYPNLETGTLRYSEDANEDNLEIEINHRIQEENLINEIPCFDPDLETKFTIESKKVISTNPDSDVVISKLNGKIINMVADLKAGERTSATDTETTELKSNGNTILTAGNEIENKFCTVKTTGGTLQVNEFIEAAKIETIHTLEAAASLNDVTVSNLPILPSVGQWCEGGKMYNYNGQAIYCVQGHNRTIYEPSETPALFSVYRAETGNLEWIPNEMVEIGWIRTENGTEYECIQAHMTLEGWTPSATPALWQQVQGTEIPVWVQPTGSHDAYNIGDQVHFPTINDPVYESIINANVWSPAVYPAGWQIQI